MIVETASHRKVDQGSKVPIHMYILLPSLLPRITRPCHTTFVLSLPAALSSSVGILRRNSTYTYSFVHLSVWTYVRYYSQLVEHLWLLSFVQSLLKSARWNSRCVINRSMLFWQSLFQERQHRCSFNIFKDYSVKVDRFSSLAILLDYFSHFLLAISHNKPARQRNTKCSWEFTNYGRASQT